MRKLSIGCRLGCAILTHLFCKPKNPGFETLAGQNFAVEKINFNLISFLMVWLGKFKKNLYLLSNSNIVFPLPAFLFYKSGYMQDQVYINCTRCLVDGGTGKRRPCKSNVRGLTPYPHKFSHRLKKKNFKYIIIYFFKINFGHCLSLKLLFNKSVRLNVEIKKGFLLNA